MRPDGGQSAPRSGEPVSRGLGAPPLPPEPFIPGPSSTQTTLDAVPSTRVSVIVSPAGTGKTAAAAGWALHHADRLRIRWVTGRTLGADDGGSAEAFERWVLAEPDPTDTETGVPSVLVVDDAHLLPREIESVLARLLLRRDPHQPSLLILSRHDVTFIPIELELSGEVCQLRFPDLRMDDDRAAALVRVHHPAATPAQVEAVLAQSDGWAAALVLGARSLHGTVDATPLSSVPPHPTLDYVTSEVLDALPSALRGVLVATGQESEITQEDAEVLAGDAHAADLLAMAAVDGFVVTTHRHDTDPRAVAWRVHPLLGEVLRRRAAPGGPDTVTLVAAHERAVRHHRHEGNAAAAMRHASLTGDLVIQLSVMEEVGLDLLLRDQGAVVAEALTHFHAELRDSVPLLQVIDALLLRGLRRPEAAKRVADKALALAPADSWAENGPGPERDLEVELAILDVWQARCGWRPSAGAITRASRALRCRHRGEADPASPGSGHDTTGISPLTSAWLMLDLASLQLWVGDVTGAGIHIQVAATYAQGAGLARLSGAVQSLSATLEVVQGAYQTAAHTADAALRVHREAGYVADITTSRAHLMRGWARFHAFDLDGAGEDLGAVEDTPTDPSDPISLVYRRLLAVNLLTATGQVEEARRLLDVEADAFGPPPPYVERHLSLAGFRVAGFMGDLAAMEDEVEALSRAGYRDDAAFTRAVVLGLRGRAQEAISSLDALLTGPGHLRRDHGELSRVTAASAAVSRAAFLQRVGTADSLARAASLVPDMLSRIAPHRLLWILATGTMVTPAFSELVAAEAERPGAHPFAAEALEALLRHPRPYPDLTPAGAARLAPDLEYGGPLPAGLTRRELDVLRALALGGSNAVVARSLFVSENTVKTHLAALYRKLGVTGRGDAIDAGRRLGLL